MGEIKSTLELVMERTENMVPSAEERAEMSRQEHVQHAQAAVRRLLGGELRASALAQWVTKNETESPGFPWRTAVCLDVARALDPERNGEIVVAALRALGFTRSEALQEAVHEYREQVAVADQEAADRIQEALRRDGIRGSAVIPNRDVDPDRQEALERLRHSFVANRGRILES